MQRTRSYRPNGGFHLADEVCQVTHIAFVPMAVHLKHHNALHQSSAEHKTVEEPTSYRKTGNGEIHIVRRIRVRLTPCSTRIIGFVLTSSFTCSVSLISSRYQSNAKWPPSAVVKSSREDGSEVCQVTRTKPEDRQPFGVSGMARQRIKPDMKIHNPRVSGMPHNKVIGHV